MALGDEAFGSKHIIQVICANCKHFSYGRNFAFDLPFLEIEFLGLIFFKPL
jgi:hypothetical protein